MGRAKTWCWLLVLLSGCNGRIRTGEDWPDAGALWPDGNAGAAGQGGAPGTGGAGADGSGGATGATAGTGGVATGGGTGGTSGTGGTGGGTGGVGGGAAGKGGSSGGSGGSSGSVDGGAGDACGPGPTCPLANAWIPSAACGAAACGNGVIDSCNECGRMATELCDGSALGGRTCQDFGDAGGPLKCSTRCGWDTSACTRCSATDDVLRACINAPVDASVPTRIAMDATDQEIAIAWTSPDAAGVLRLHFARFAPDLTLISESGPFIGTCPDEIALAARPGGWSLVVTSHANMHLLALDATGAQTAVRPVASLWSSRTNTKVVLAHREGTGPLLAWDDGFAGDPPIPTPYGWGHIMLVGADGNSIASGPAPLHFDAPTLESIAAIPTPVGWLVASDHHSADGSNLSEIEIVETNWDGILQRDAPRAGLPNGKPRMAAEGRDFRMSFLLGGSVYVTGLAYNGVLLGEPVALGPQYNHPAPLVLIDGSTSVFAAFGTGNAPRALHYLQYDANFKPVGAPRVIATDADAIKTYVAARRGPDAIVAWINGTPPAPGTSGIGPSSIGLARVTPAM